MPVKPLISKGSCFMQATANYLPPSISYGCRKFVNYAFLKYSAGNADATEAYEEAIAALCYRLHQPTSLSLECKFENYLWGIAKHKLEKMLEYREVNILMEDYPLPEIFVRYVDEITGESESKEINIDNFCGNYRPLTAGFLSFAFINIMIMHL